MTGAACCAGSLWSPGQFLKLVHRSVVRNCGRYQRACLWNRHLWLLLRQCVAVVRCRGTQRQRCRPLFQPRPKRFATRIPGRLGSPRVPEIFAPFLWATSAATTTARLAIASPGRRTAPLVGTIFLGAGTELGRFPSGLLGRLWRRCCGPNAMRDVVGNWLCGSRSSLGQRELSGTLPVATATISPHRFPRFPRSCRFARDWGPVSSWTCPSLGTARRRIGTVGFLARSRGATTGAVARTPRSLSRPTVAPRTGRRAAVAAGTPITPFARRGTWPSR